MTGKTREILLTLIALASGFLMVFVLIRAHGNAPLKDPNYYKIVLPLSMFLSFVYGFTEPDKFLRMGICTMLLQPLPWHFDHSMGAFILVELGFFFCFALLTVFTSAIGSQIRKHLQSRSGN